MNKNNKERDLKTQNNGSTVTKKLTNLDLIDSSSSQFFDIQKDRFLTTKEAAAILSISVFRLLNLCSNGKIPYYKLGRSNRFLLKELVELLNFNKKGPGSYGN